MACCQPASADCSEELLRDGIPNDTAAAIATNCFDLIYFSFLQPSTTTTTTRTHCCSFLSSSQHHQPSIQFLSLSPSPSVFIDTYTVCTRDTISSSAPCQWQGTSVSRSPLPQSVRVRVGHSLDWPVWKGLWAEQGRTGLDMRASRRKLVPRSILPCLPCLPHAICICLCVFCEDLASIDSDFVGQRAPRHQKQLKAASICPLDLCVS